MEHAVELGAGWRKALGYQLKIYQYYPIDITQLDVAYAQQHGDLFRSISRQDQLQRKSNIRKHFIFTDLQLIINDTDAVVVYYDESVRKGAGTISECQVAYNHDIPIFVVSAYPQEQIPGWLTALSTKIFFDFSSLVAYLAALPPGIMKRDIFGNRHSGAHYLCSLCGTPFVKHKTHFVSKVSPLYCGPCVDLVKETYEQHKDRYEFFIEQIENEHEKELKGK
jgi:hypothetical protein